jgi:hypothetical protein
MIGEELLDSDRTARAGASTIPGEFLEEDASVGARRERGQKKQGNEIPHALSPLRKDTTCSIGRNMRKRRLRAEGPRLRLRARG